MLLVESLKRLFEDNKIDNDKLIQFVEKGTISEKEKNYILGKEELDVYHFNK